jgi:hypothetical protein
MFAASKSGSAADPTDAQFNYVTMLLHGDGTNGSQNNTFIDVGAVFTASVTLTTMTVSAITSGAILIGHTISGSGVSSATVTAQLTGTTGSTGTYTVSVSQTVTSGTISSSFAITRNGNTTQGTFTPYGSNWSNYLNGSSSLSVNVSGVAAGTSTFTFEAWVYLNAYPASDAAFYDTRSSNGASTTAMQFGVYSTGALKFYDGTETNLGGTVPLNQWVHIALVRNGSNVMTPYINGTATGTTVSSTRNFSDQYFWICSVPGPASPYINAYLSNLRWVVGTAVYTSNFTPSTTPLTAITNTKILTCQSNRFVDNSSNTFAITLNGSPSVQRFSPFSPTTAYSTSVIGGSMYADGTGDYLSAADNAAFDLGSSDFTIEGWVFLSSSGSSQTFVAKGTGADNQASYHIVFNGTNWLYYLSGNGSTWSIASGVTMGAGTANTWQHLALVRSGSTFTPYVNGTAGTTTSSATALFDGNKVFSIGADDAANQILTGYISNTRVVKGTAVYTASFTPPTAPLTAITNTSLLLNFTNAGIIDNAIMNDLETVGNAQISTSVKKYGTGSIALDGTGDYLLTGNKTNFNVGSGDFTIEAWVYSGSASQQVIMGANRNSDGVGAWMFNLNYTGKVRFFCSYSGGSYVDYNVGTGTISDSAWHHVAVTRSGSSLRIFIDGTQTGTTNTTLGTASIDNAIADYRVGSTTDNDLYFNGYIDDLRITKGVARYTANFTAPIIAFADKGPIT